MKNSDCCMRYIKMPKSLQFFPKEVVEVWKPKTEGKFILKILLDLRLSKRDICSVLQRGKHLKNTYRSE